MRNHQQVAVRLRDAAADELADSGPRDFLPARCSGRLRPQL